MVKSIENHYINLFPLLKRENLKFNVNLFLIYALPRLLLIPINLNPNIKKEKEEFFLLVKKKFKMWTGLGKSLATEACEDLLGFSL